MLDRRVETVKLIPVDIHGDSVVAEPEMETGRIAGRVEILRPAS